MKKNDVFGVLGALALAVTLLHAPALAAGPKFSVTPAPPYTARNAKFKVTAITPTLLHNVNANYTNAFNSWNNSLPKADQWAPLVFGGELSNTALLTVSTYTAYVDNTGGGVTINIDYTPGAKTDPAQGTAKWTQSVRDQYKPNQKPPLSPGNPWLDGPYNFIVPDQTDTLPLYPFNNAMSSFGDMPHLGLGPGGRARTVLFDAYLAITDKKTLTVYNGVEWGFTIFPIPETSTMTSFGLLLFLGSVLVWRRSKSKPV